MKPPAFGNPDPSGRPTEVEKRSALRALPSEADDEARAREVLLRAAEGDESAVRALYRTYVSRVHRHVARILGRDDPDVEDVVQKVFLAALRGARRFDGRSAVSTWILGIATRRALDEARSRWRRRRFSKLLEHVGIGRIGGRPDARHGALSEAEQALAKLDPHQRTVFVLHEVEGHTLEEIREMTGTAVSTLHARLKKARAILERAALSDGGAR